MYLRHILTFSSYIEAMVVGVAITLIFEWFFHQSKYMLAVMGMVLTSDIFQIINLIVAVRALTEQRDNYGFAFVVILFVGLLMNVAIAIVVLFLMCAHSATFCSDFTSDTILMLSVTMLAFTAKVIAGIVFYFAMKNLSDAIKKRRGSSSFLLKDVDKDISADTLDAQTVSNFSIE